MTASTTFVYFKTLDTDTQIGVNLASILNPNEILVSTMLGSVSPISDPILTATMQTNNLVNTVILLKGGAENVSYGIPLIVNTNLRAVQLLIAITVATVNQVPYVTQNPEAYSDLLDTIEAGNAALAVSVFPFTPDVDPSGGYVNWEFLDSSGAVYASGNAFDYVIKSNGLSNTVLAQSVINVPTSVPASLNNQKYQLRYTLTLPNAEPGTQSKFYSYENVTVVGLNTVPLGTQPAIEMCGDPVTLSLVTDKLYDNVGLEVYYDNNLISNILMITDFERVANGYYYAAVVDSTNMPVGLDAYTVVWKYWQSANPAQIFRENAQLWIVNPAILQCIDDVKSEVSQARTTLYGTPDMLYSSTTIMVWLRRGRDAFNGAYGQFTSFTMTNPKGPIREYFLKYVSLAALAAGYLRESEEVFNFEGAAIKLEVDRTSYLQTAILRIQTILDNEVMLVKKNCIIKGASSGDGSVDPSRLSRGAIGAIGITISQVSQYGTFGYGRRGF